MSKTKAKISIFLIVLLTFTYIAVGSQIELNAYAASNISVNNTANNFDSINVLEDLKSAEIDGEPFNLSDYPYNTSSTPVAPKIIGFIEYCFSYRTNMLSNYGLYVYIYNPSSLDIEEDGERNKIQLGVSYGACIVPDENGNEKTQIMPTEYEKFDLKFCNKSIDDEHFGLFYKFRIIDRESYSDGRTILERISDDLNEQQSNGVSIIECERRYDVSGIEIAEIEAQNAVEYGVGGTFVFKGFSKGYGPNKNADSTLSCTVKDLETIELEVHPTVYRMRDEYKAWTTEQVNSVYFSVPEEYYTKYGSLQKIKAEWYEYKTTPIFVAEQIDETEVFYPMLGKDIGLRDNDFNYRVVFEVVDEAMFADIKYKKWYETLAEYWALSPLTMLIDQLAGDNYFVGNCYNQVETDLIDSSGGFWVWGEDNYIFQNDFYVSRMDWIIHSENGKVSPKQLKNYMQWYTQRFPNQNKVHGYAENLFEASIDEDRVQLLQNTNAKRGYVLQELDAGESIDLRMYSSFSGSWFKRKFGIKDKTTTTVAKTYSPIYEVKQSDFGLSSVKSICENLLISEDDYESKDNNIGFREFCDNAYSRNERPVLFRFANTDYYCSRARFDELHDGGMSGNDGYVAQETMFLDFDIIQLTFNKDGDYTVIPAVSSPVDVIGGLIPPPVRKQSNKNILKYILLALILLVIIIVLLPLWPKILSGLAWLFTKIAMIIAAPFKGIAKAVKRRKQEKNKTER